VGNSKTSVSNTQRAFFSPEVATQMKIEKSELQMTVKLQNDRIEALKVEAAKVTTLEALLEEMGQMKAMPGNTKDVLVENIGKYEKVPGEYNVVEVVFNGLDTPGIAWDYSLIHVANKRLWQGSGPEHDFACARIKNIRAGSMADKSGVLEVGMCVIRVTGLFVLTSKIEDDGVPWETMEVLESDLRPKAVRFIKVRSDMEVGILTALMRHQRALMVENLEKKKLSYHYFEAPPKEIETDIDVSPPQQPRRGSTSRRGNTGRRSSIGSHSRRKSISTPIESDVSKSEAHAASGQSLQPNSESLDGSLLMFEQELNLS